MVDVIKQATLILAATTLVACASSSNQQSASESPAQQAAPVVASADGAAEVPVVYGNADRMVCKRIAPTGTRISTRVCKKQREWDALSKNASEAGADAQRRATHSNATR